MKVLLTDNAHLYRTPDGKYYTTSIYSYNFFKPYLEVFDEVRFLSRVKYVEKIDEENFLLVSGDGLEIFELPWYQGIRGLIKRSLQLIKRYKRACDGCDCYIMRVAQMESYLAFLFGRRKKKPLALEVVNDPSTLIIGPRIFNVLNKKIMEKIIKSANGVSYVTKNYLQELYPSTAHKISDSEMYFHAHYSDVNLLESDIINGPRQYEKSMEKLKIIHIANSISGELKGHRTLIKATKELQDQGYDVSVDFVGEGDSVEIFEELAVKLGIDKKITFVGKLNSKEKVIKALDASDIFILPSFTEGLPRVILEAQARGVPCLSTPVGGIPELLDERYLFNPEDYKTLSQIVISLLQNPEELEKMSRKNIETACNYTIDKMGIQRNEYYNKLKNLAVLSKKAY